MGRAPCCEKVGLKRGRWTTEEDDILTKYIQAHGEGSWRSLPKNAGILIYLVLLFLSFLIFACLKFMYIVLCLYNGLVRFVSTPVVISLLSDSVIISVFDKIFLCINWK